MLKQNVAVLGLASKAAPAHKPEPVVNLDSDEEEEDGGGLMARLTGELLIQPTFNILAILDAEFLLSKWSHSGQIAVVPGKTIICPICWTVLTEPVFG